MVFFFLANCLTDTFYSETFVHQQKTAVSVLLPWRRAGPHPGASSGPWSRARGPAGTEASTEPPPSQQKRRLGCRAQEHKRNLIQRQQIITQPAAPQRTKTCYLSELSRSENNEKAAEMKRWWKKLTLTVGNRIWTNVEQAVKGENQSYAELAAHYYYSCCIMWEPEFYCINKYQSFSINWTK